jgi:hypothetical protein
VAHLISKAPSEACWVIGLRPSWLNIRP